MSYSTENLFESTRISQDVPAKFLSRPRTAIPNETRGIKSSSREESTESLNSSQFSPQSNKVYLRLKPRSPKSKLAKRIQEAMYVVTNATTLITKFPSDSSNSVRSLRISDATSKKFKFSKIFEANSQQHEIFEGCTSDAIADFLSGQSTTIMSYGTTNSGKTFTLHGTFDSPGIVPRSIELIYSSITCTLSPWYKPIGYEIINLTEENRHLEGELREKLLSRLTSRSESLETWKSLEKSANETLDSIHSGDALYSVWLSFAEIYNEAVFDLLDEDDNKMSPLKLVTDKQGRSFIHGLKMVSATTGLDAYQIFLTGQSRLKISEQPEAGSSLSHSVFTITLLKYFKEFNPDEVVMSTMTFCDLAGAGRSKINATSAGDTRKQEKSIKTGLLALGKCLQSVHARQCGKVNAEVIGPFRESKLTRLFQRSLNGKEPLVIIANVDPSPEFYVENQSILHLCSIARKIHVTGRELTKYFTSELMIPSPIVASKTEENLPEFELKDDEDYKGLKEENLSLQKEIEILKSNASARELKIREEMEDFCTAIIKDMELNWRGKFPEETAEDQRLLSETYCVERVSSMRSRKRRRAECDDDDDDQPSLRLLEAENARITSDHLLMTETLQNLRKECKALRTEKNYYSFELGLANEELKGIRSFLTSEVGWASSDDGDLLKHLKLLICEKNKKIKLLEESLKNEKMQMHELIEAEESDDAQNSKNELSSIFIGDSTRSDFSDSSGEDTIEPEDSSASILTVEETQELEIIEIEQQFSTSIFETIDKTLDSIKIDGQGDSGIAISNATSSCTRNTFVETENKGIQADLSDSQEQKRMIEDRVEKLKFDYKQLQSEHLQGSIRIAELSKELDQIRRVMENLKEVMYQSDQKIIGYQLRLASQDVDLDTLRESNVELKRELSKAHLDQEKSSLQCIKDHLPKINKLQHELIEKTDRINSLNSKILQIERDLELLNHLSDKVRDFGDILEKFEREKFELRQELQERTLSQSSLECRLKLLSSRVQNRENEITSLRTDLAGIVRMNTVNGERANELSQDIANALVKLTISKDEMRRSEVERRQLERASSHEISHLAASYERSTEILSMIHDGDNDTRSELDRIKLLLSKKEREMALFRKNRDSTIRRYESLVRKLQADIERNNRELLRVRRYSRRTISKESLESVEQESSREVHRDSLIKARSTKRTFNIKNRRTKHHCRLMCSARRLSSQIVASLTSLDGSKSNNCEVLDVQSELPSQKRSMIKVLQADRRELQMPPDVTTPSVTSSAEDSATDYKEFSKWMKINRTDGRTQFVIRQAEITVENAVGGSFSEDQ